MHHRFIAILATAGSLVALAAPMREVVLDVAGMTCATCPLTVKAVLKGEPGVGDAKVDMQRHNARVTFDPDKVSAEHLAAAVSEAGFPAKIVK